MAIVMNNYFKKIDFKYNRKSLIDIADKHLDSATEGYVDSDGNQVSYGSFYDNNEKSDAKLPTTLFFTDMPEDFRHLEIFKDLCKLFANTNTNKKLHDIDHLYYYAQFFKVSGPLLPHADERTCAFTIPLYGVTHPVCWYEDDGETMLEKYIYDGPTLINTSIKHGCMDNTGVRLFFQIGGFAEPFKEIAEAI
jgi:hypothetical protein